MQASDYENFRHVMASMGAVYGKEITPALIDGYWNALCGWDIEDFKSAAATLMEISEFFPRPAAFTEIRKSLRATPQEQWDRVMAFCSSSAWRDSESIVERSIDLAVQAIGGYERIAMSDLDKIHFLENKFCDVYGAIDDRNETVSGLRTQAA